MRTLGRMRGQGSDSSVSRRGDFAAISALRAAAGAAVALRNAPAGAAGGEFLSGCPERNQRGTRAPFRWALRAHIYGPWTPFYGGRQCGRPAIIAKARAAQLTGFSSITAAAEFPGTFGCFFYR